MSKLEFERLRNLSRQDFYEQEIRPEIWQHLLPFARSNKKVSIPYLSRWENYQEEISLDEEFKDIFLGWSGDHCGLWFDFRDKETKNRPKFLGLF